MQSDCLFCRMSSGEIPVEKVYEDDRVFAIRDINPRAPVHVMIIPKEHIASARELTEARATLLSHSEGVADSGYRLTFNVGEDGGQTILHLHLHLLGGRRLGPEA